MAFEMSSKLDVVRRKRRSLNKFKMIKYWMILLFLLNACWAATPYQAITGKDSRLIYADGSVVHLFGVNFQPMFSWEHAARMYNQGV